MEVKEDITGKKAGELKPRKLGYEELENTAHQLSEQSRQLYIQNQKLNQALQEANLINFYKRLDYLWTVITSETPYITEDFKQACGNEFMTLMSRPEEETETKEEEE